MKEVSLKIEKIAQGLGSSYTKDKLIKYYRLSQVFVVENLKLARQEGVSDELLNSALSKKVPPKAKMAEVAALPFVSAELYAAFLAGLPEQPRQLWEALVWVEELRGNQIEEEMGFTVIEEETITYARTTYVSKRFTVKPAFEFLLEERRGYYRRRDSPADFQFALAMDIRRVVCTYYPQPDEAKLLPAKSLEATQHRYLSGEQDALMELPRVLTYRSQGQIKATKKNRPAFATLGKMRKKLSIQEFFPAHKDRKLSTLRTSLLAAAALQMPQRKNDKGVVDTLRSFFKANYAERVELPPMLLPDLKGMGYMDSYDFRNENAKPFKLLKQLPKGEWVPVENIFGFLAYHLIAVRPVLSTKAPNTLYYEYEDPDPDSYIYDDKHYLSSFSYQEAVTKPFVRGSFFLYAAFGLCDLVYDDPDLEHIGRTCFSSWDGLRYVRRTALGDYICGISKSYDTASLAEGPSITLSPDALLILSEEGDSAAAALLTPYAEQIGHNRFRTDNQVFLKNIRSKQELEAKITLFKQVVGDQLPPNWATFFQDLLYKINPFESVRSVEVLKIPPENKELIQLIAQDTVLKSLAVKAEGFLLIVTKTDYAAFKKRLQEFGYLLT